MTRKNKIRAIFAEAEAPRGVSFSCYLSLVLGIVRVAR
jgi:hypothetical protein